MRVGVRSVRGCAPTRLRQLVGWELAAEGRGLGLRLQALGAPPGAPPEVGKEEADQGAEENEAAECGARDEGRANGRGSWARGAWVSHLAKLENGLSGYQCLVAFEKGYIRTKKVGVQAAQHPVLKRRDAGGRDS